MELPIRSLAARGVGFGTSGVRATVDALTDEVCYAYAAAFLKVLARRGPVRRVAIGHDLRPSSPRITAACAAACRDAGAEVVHCGALPTPALAHHAMGLGLPAIVVTGSHIPFDRNGIKFYTPQGEILKEDEAAITAATVALPEGAFAEGRLVRPAPLPPVDAGALAGYVQRYAGFVPAGILRGRRVGLYEHSSVARDVLKELLAALGAEVVPLGRTDTFVPVDTEAVSEADEQKARAWVAEHRLDALVSTDGDADRPLISDERGEFFRGDLVGLLCARFLGARTVVTPVSSNTAVERCGAFAQVVRTRIGSPYVIAAMSAPGAQAPVAGYEANGGFLLGSEIVRGGARLAPLPTRDAALPIVALLVAAAERGQPLSALRQGLPARFTASDRIAAFETAKSQRLLARLSGDPAALRAFFQPLGAPAGVDQTDGLRVTLGSGEIVHLRPSGNAPELRCYAEADSPERARELLAWGLQTARASAEQPST
ncbi:MAG: phosphomannomutase [Anaeromyxobacter sp.]